MGQRCLRYRSSAELTYSRDPAAFCLYIKLSGCWGAPVLWPAQRVFDLLAFCL